MMEPLLKSPSWTSSALFCQHEVMSSVSPLKPNQASQDAPMTPSPAPDTLAQEGCSGLGLSTGDTAGLTKASINRDTPRQDTRFRDPSPDEKCFPVVWCLLISWQ